MQNLCVHFKRFTVIFIALFITFVLFIRLPIFQGLDFSVHGWGWGVLLLIGFSLTGVISFTQSFIFEFAKISEQQSPRLHTTIEGFIDGMVPALALVISSFFVPTLVIATSVSGVLAFGLLMGVGFAASNLVSVLLPRQANEKKAEEK